MPYFSRLTDIVTCNLTTLLARNENCAQFLKGIIQEMKEGVAGAQRCVGTAISNVAQLEADIGEQRIAAGDWIRKAQEALRHSDDSQARMALERKHEVEDLIAGLEQQLQAAISTREHLSTMLNALQARLADAVRRLDELSNSKSAPAPAAGIAFGVAAESKVRQSRVDSELEELRRQMQAE